MEEECVELYGMAGTFFTTDRAYEIPQPAERDFHPFPEMLADSGSESDDEVAEFAFARANEAVVDDEVVPGPALPPTQELDKATKSLIAKMRENAFEARRRAVQRQAENMTKMWPLITGEMSAASLAKVKEFPNYRLAKGSRDVVMLWEFIRKSHLTHVYGEGDGMRAVNINDQKLKFNNMRQGDRESTSDFKSRYDNQTKANEGVGIVQDDEDLVAIDFLGKLDPKRYTAMLTVLRNNAAINLSSYPTTLAGAYRTASTWTTDGTMSATREQHSAFVMDKVPDKPKASNKEKRSKGGPVEKKSSSEVECFVCSKLGHYARECPDRKTRSLALVVNSEQATYSDADSDDEFTKVAAFVTTIATRETVLFAGHILLLDNQSSANVVASGDLLKSIRRAEHPIILNGVNKDTPGVKVDMVGDLGDIGEVYYCPKAAANILSFAAMSDAGADIRYDRKNHRFTLKPRGSELIYSFCRQKLPGSDGRFYMCDTRSMIASKPTFHPHSETALVATVAENMRKYTKREVESAAAARELLARMGYPSVENAIAMIRGGDNMKVTESDFRIAHDIWGKDITSMRGKTKKQSSPIADMIITAPLVQREQVLSVDVMFVESVPSLVAVCTPLDLVLAVTLKSSDMTKAQRTASAIKNGLDNMISTLKSRGFVVTVIYSDGEGAIGKVRPYLNFLGIEVDVSGAGGHVARIERKIQMIKERVRCHITGRIPFTLTALGISMLILYCASRLNYQRSGVTGNCPREEFSGRRVDGTRDFRAAFGDYAVCTVPETHNSMESRVTDGYVVLPTGNRTGSVKIYNILTQRIITRDQFKILPMPESVIQFLNNQALSEGRKLNTAHMHVFDELLNSRKLSNSNMPSFFTPLPMQDSNDSIELTQNADINPQYVRVVPGSNPVPLIPRIEPGGEADIGLVAQNDSFHTLPNEDEGSDQEQDIEYNDPPAEQTADGGVPEPADSGLLESESEADDIAAPISPSLPIPPTPPASPSIPQTSGDLLKYFRTALTVTTTKPTGLELVIAMLEARKDSTEVLSSANISVKNALRTKGVEAERVIQKELKQMLDRRVFKPVHRANLTQSQQRSIIRSSMFIKAKYLPDGAFDKLKARLVAGGDQQDKSLYDELSSATVSTSSVFTLAAVAAYEKRSVAVVDIGGAFLNADMGKTVPVHMRLDKTMTGFLVKLDPSYSRFMDDRGGVTVVLVKALYGCVESSSLWYDNLSRTMTSLGYKRNAMDVCVFNRLNSNGLQCTVTVHVDDLLIMSASEAMITELTEGLRKRYGDISLKHGPVVNYLGMVLDFSHAGEARVTMCGYIEDVLKSSGISGTARTPGTDGLFEVRDTALPVPESVRVWFHRAVAMILYLAKRAKPECLTAVAFLATRVTKCNSDDVDKLIRLLRYIRASKDMGMVLRPGVSGIRVHLFVDASYGVHVDGRSHTGSCVVVGDRGAVHCRSSKQLIVTKSSTEAELVGLSDSANQGLFLRNFLTLQGYRMAPLTAYQDNLSCMALLARGRSGGERSRHIDIRYFWTKDRVDRGDMVIEHKGTAELYANLLTKPLQGSQFVYERECLTGWPKTERKE